MATVAQLQKMLAALTKGQRALLLEMARFMQVKIETNQNPKSNLTSEAFVENLTNRLLIHHATNAEKLKKKSFEFAFKAACEAAGKKASIVSSQTNPGADVIVNHVRFSLKTEAAASIKDSALTISKLMEARWIRECQTNAAFARRAKSQITKHLDEYQRIISLRAFDRPGNEVEYELVEIPVPVLRLCSALTASDFNTRTKNGSNSAFVSYKGERAFKLVLDGSVEKVTISGLQKSLCIVHGSWKIPLLGASGN